MAKSLRNLLNRNLQCSVSLMCTSLWPCCSAANSITCCTSFEVSAYDSISATSLSPFEFLCLHRTYFVLALLTDLICFLQLGITAETQDEMEKRWKKTPGSERPHFTCWASLLLRRYGSPLPSPVHASQTVELLLLYAHLFCVSQYSIKDKMLKLNGIILALRHYFKIPRIISKLVGRFLSDNE